MHMNSDDFLRYEGVPKKTRVAVGADLRMDHFRTYDT
jgi:hypothetical protein